VARLRAICAAIISVLPVLSAAHELCEPTPQIQQEIANATAAAPGKGSFGERTAPFKARRERFPKDLFVHVRYQDAVNDHGIEGYLKHMAEEYLALRDAHPGELLYQYLLARTLEGRNTKGAIAAMKEVLSRDINFPPAHRTLAEIYGSKAFKDRPNETAERGKLQELCPGTAIAARPTPPPAKSELCSQAEALLKQLRSDERVPELVYQALSQDEWRLQRIRPYDWYTVSFKKEAGRALQIEYWNGWRMIVQHFWKTEQTAKADQLLDEMQGRLAHLEREPTSEVYWAGATTLVNLYAQAKQTAKAREILAKMQSSLKAKPDAKRAAELARLKAKFLSRG
jgi:pentatricopeptide repeat protein